MSTCLMTSFNFTSLKPSMLDRTERIKSVRAGLTPEVSRTPAELESYQACKAQMGSISVT